MLTPVNLFRMMTEMIFVLLGGFLVWAGLSRLPIDPRRPLWLVLGAVLVYWGARAWTKTANAAWSAERTPARIGGTSLALVGLMMLGLAFVGFRWVGTALALMGAILMLRGLSSAVLALRAN